MTPKDEKFVRLKVVNKSSCMISMACNIERIVKSKASLRYGGKEAVLDSKELTGKTAHFNSTHLCAKMPTFRILGSIRDFKHGLK